MEAGKYASSSYRKRAKAISSVASRIFFLLIIFQLPLFRIEGRSGTWTSPVQITCSQLIATEILPVDLIRILLYPGAIANSLVNGLTIPAYAHVFDFYNLTRVKNTLNILDLNNLEILAGSYLSVSGAILGVVNQGRLSLFGILLLLWGLAKELIREDYTFYVHISPGIFFAILAALLSDKGDVREVIRSFTARDSAVEANELEEEWKQKRKEREMKRLEWNVNYNSNTTRSTKVAQQVGIMTSCISKMKKN